MTQEKKLKVRHLITCCAIIFITTATLIYNAFMLSDNYNEPISRIEATKNLKMFVPISYNDTIWVNVQKGDSLWVLGRQGSQERSRHALWVEDNKGNRGFISAEEMGYELKAENPQTTKLENTTILGFDHGFSRYYCKFADGTTKKIDHAKVYPQMPEDLKMHCINLEGPRVTMSGDKFKSMVMGKTLKEIEQQTYPAKLVIHHRDSTIAYFKFIDVIDLDGSKCHTHPVVRFDGNGVATNCNFDVSNATTDKYIIRYMPFVKQIIDAPIVQNITKTPFWTPSIFLTDAPPTKTLRAVVIVIFIFGLLWIWLLPLVPIATIGALMHIPVTLKPINNLTLRIIMIVATLISCYVWFVSIQMWGHIMIFLIINIVIAYMAYKYIASPLDNYIPHDRCLSCRNLFAMEFVDEVYDHEYTEWRNESNFAKTVSRSHYKYKTWTHVTYRNNSTSGSYDKDIKTHYGTTTTKLYNDYEVLYKVTVYKQTFKCKKCGNLEYDYPTRSQEIDRKYIGQHTNTSTEEECINGGRI